MSLVGVLSSSSVLSFGALACDEGDAFKRGELVAAGASSDRFGFACFRSPLLLI